MKMTVHISSQAHIGLLGSPLLSTNSLMVVRNLILKRIALLFLLLLLATFLQLPQLIEWRHSSILVIPCQALPQRGSPLMSRNWILLLL